MAVIVQILLNENLFVKNPDHSDLGRRIVSSSIDLIDDLGFESFTFKKLGTAIGTTEASIYRYFENKHKLLSYLINWYWGWLEFQIDFAVDKSEKPKEKLDKVLRIISESQKFDPHVSYIDETRLHRIVVSEAAKVYLTKNVEFENREGLFANYKSLCEKIASILLENNPTYRYPKTLATNLVETAHEQIFFAAHLHSLTDLRFDADDYSPLLEFLRHIAFSSLGISEQPIKATR
jgi:AcrR family transcriptional regulator